MKFLTAGVITFALLCLTTSAGANPLRFPTRVFYSAAEEDVNLKPLFDWWTANQDIAISVESTNPPLTSEQLSHYLPPRPLDRWLHITATNFATLGDGWVMAARIEDYPGHSTNHAIFLKHPPGRDRVNFLWVQANYTQIGVAITNARAQVQTSGAVATAARTRARNFAPAGMVLSGELVTTATDLKNVANEDFQYYQESQRTLSSLEATKQAMDEFIKEFDGESFYKLDFFALDTGFTNGVLPVFDLGELKR